MFYGDLPKDSWTALCERHENHHHHLNAPSVIITDYYGTNYLHHCWYGTIGVTLLHPAGKQGSPNPR